MLIIIILIIMYVPFLTGSPMKGWRWTAVSVQAQILGTLFKKRMIRSHTPWFKNI